MIKTGEDVRIHDSVIIKNTEHCKIGNHVSIDSGVVISTKVIIGDYIHISPHVCLIGGENSEVILHDFCFIAAGTKVVAGSEEYSLGGLIGATIPKQFRRLKFSTITFNKYSGCGVNCSIMPGVTFGEGAILGANSLATKDLEPWTIYVGSPAKPIKMRNKEEAIRYAKELGYD